MALPALPDSIDTDTVDLVLGQRRFCTSDEHSVEEIVEVPCGSEASRRLVLVRLSHEKGSLLLRLIPKFFKTSGRSQNSIAKYFLRNSFLTLLKSIIKYKKLWY